MPRRMTAKNRELVVELAKKDPDALGPQLGIMCLQYNLPVESIASALDVSPSALFLWFYGKAEPSLNSRKYLKRLLIILRRALLAHEFPLQGPYPARVERMVEIIKRYRG